MNSQICGNAELYYSTIYAVGALLVVLVEGAVVETARRSCPNLIALNHRDHIKYV